MQRQGIITCRVQKNKTESQFNKTFNRCVTVVLGSENKSYTVTCESFIKLTPSLQFRAELFKGRLR